MRALLIVLAFAIHISHANAGCCVYGMLNIQPEECSKAMCNSTDLTGVTVGTNLNNYCSTTLASAPVNTALAKCNHPSVTTAQFAALNANFASKCQYVATATSCKKPFVDPTNGQCCKHKGSGFVGANCAAFETFAQPWTPQNINQMKQSCDTFHPGGSGNPCLWDTSAQGCNPGRGGGNAKGATGQ